MNDEPGYTPEQVIRRVPRALLAAGIAGLAGATAIATLWATEPGRLPTRTAAAFAGLIVIGLSWAVLAGWTLLKRPVFAAERVAAGTLAVVFTTASTLVTAVIGGPLAAGPGLLLITVAMIVLVRARAYRGRLRSQIAALEGQRREPQD
jgi:hypothetical protein